MTKQIKRWKLYPKRWLVAIGILCSPLAFWRLGLLAQSQNWLPFALGDSSAYPASVIELFAVGLLYVLITVMAGLVLFLLYLGLKALILWALGR